MPDSSAVNSPPARLRGPTTSQTGDIRPGWPLNGGAVQHGKFDAGQRLGPTKPVDTAWIDFSKGPGAPIGAALAGSEELIEEAWRYKQMTGGAMRQAGIVAVGALWALDHHVDRLAEDHARR